MNQDLTGTYKIYNNKLYLKFSKSKGEIESKSDSANISEIFGNFHNYDLKFENGIEYHKKLLIKNKKLFNYRVDNDKLVKKAKNYSDSKKYIFFGSKWKMKKFYLKKVE